jgi:hypothetical protein
MTWIPKEIIKMYKDNGFTEEEMFETEKKVYATYPETKREQECATEKQRIDGKRDGKRKRIIISKNGKAGVRTNIRTDEPEAGEEMVP